MKAFEVIMKGTSSSDLKSVETRDIKNQLYALLNQVTDKDVLALDKEFYSCRTEHEKNSLLTEFEVSQDSAWPKRNPVLLQQWAHYCWIRLELSYLAAQRAMQNKLSAVQIKIKNHLDHMLHEKKDVAPEKLALEIPALIDSADRAIQEDAQRGVPIHESIETLRKITLQSVGTEHPTDPLSQEARDTITDLANIIETTPDDIASMKAILEKLQKIDSIPPFRRDVAEEVNRNMRMALDKLYDSTPHLIQAILNAYKKYYGEALYTKHEEEILLALRGGRQHNGQIIPPIVQHGSWAGFDADGNANITPDAMRQAIRLHRICVAEKHMVALGGIEEASKRIEQNLRREIILLNNELFSSLMKVSASQRILLQNIEFQNKASINLTDRNFHALFLLYHEQMIYINEVIKDPNQKEKIITVLTQQLQKSQILKELTQFSGSYRVSEIGLKDGLLQQFMKIFKNYKESIRESTDAFEIQEGKNLHAFPTDKALREYDELLGKSKNIFDQFPELKKQFRHFGIQLAGFRMTYGFGHVRQDSSVHVKVWSLILDDLKKDDGFLLKLLPEGKSYLNLNELERLSLQQKLQDAPEGSRILQKIYLKFHRGIYQSDPKYHKEFAIVRRELERYELVARHRDLFECLIISNSKNTANIFEVESLMRVFPKYSPWGIMIVPLLEERADLDNSEAILTHYIKARIQHAIQAAFDREEMFGESNLKRVGILTKDQIKNFVESRDRKAFKILLSEHPFLRNYLSEVTVEVMFGYSDTERVSGLPALITIQSSQEHFKQLAQDFGVKDKIFHGPGGDANRGGAKRRDPKATIQGNARSNLFTTPSNTLRFCESQFYHTYQLQSLSVQKDKKSLPPHIAKWINQCEEAGAECYEHLHDTEKGLGKLLGFMLGQGAHWMVTLLNSSSRATHRGTKEDHSDRTASVQTDGIRPESYIHPNNPRAITATQMKELLRDNIHLIMGSGYGLRMLGAEKSQRIYDLSEPVRDMVHKLMWGLATSNFSITSQAFFAGYPELLPKDARERKQWAEECVTLYPQKLATMDIEKLIKTLTGKEEAMLMMSRLFAYIEEETIQTMKFIFDLNKLIHVWEYRQPNAPKAADHSMDVLFHYPEWQKQGMEVIAEAEPLSRLLAIQNKHVAEGKCLDQIYMGINNDKNIDSKLTGVGRLLGDVGAGMTAFRIMPPALYENFSLDYRKNLRLGVTRAEVISAQLRALGVEPVKLKAAKIERDCIEKSIVGRTRVSKL